MKRHPTSSASHFSSLYQALTMDRVVESSRTRWVKEEIGSLPSVSAAFGPARPIYLGNPGLSISDSWRVCGEMFPMAQQQSASSFEFAGLRAEVDTAIRAKDFSRARRLLRSIVLSTPPILLPKDLTWARQKLALATYKDSELQTEEALEEAVRILQAEKLETTSEPETLNLAGAAHKRLWEITGDHRALRKSRSYYEHALAVGRARQSVDDWSYSAVNVAFVLDLMAREESDDSGTGITPRAADLHSQADQTRQSVCHERANMLPEAGSPAPWWRYATLAEAHLGLAQFEEAARLLRQGLERSEPPPPDWERESTARQLVALAQLRFPGVTNHQKVVEALSPLLPEGPAKSLLIGKIGLALSGGGFRAALFHIGVLARLAELDLLRHIEVLSCVSGGSILGALYYLELRKELEIRPDGTDSMSQRVYLEIVGRVQNQLEEALRKNIRNAAILGSIPKLLSNRTMLVAKLLEKRLYASAPRLRDLVFQPPGEHEFNPKLHNWRRNAKVPILILNATTLNTGHNWQFTATWMGEAPTSVEPAIDASDRLRRMYYVRDAPPTPHGDILLSTAVAASAAIPGIFRPIVLRRLYNMHPVVRLSDGGVHDNQGVFGLVEQDCNVVLISDGSGQLAARISPPWFLAGVVQRANGILMDVVRRNAYWILAIRRRTRRLRDLRIVHLKQGLPTRDVTWIGSAKELDDAVPEAKTAQVLGERAQRAIAAIRTDLDTFSPNERNALMYAGYRLTEVNFSKRPFFAAEPDPPRGNWSFLTAATWMDQDRFLSLEVERELACGQYRFFRRLRKFIRSQFSSS